MVFPVNKISSFLIVFFLLASVSLPCINACGSCKPIPKPKPKPECPPPPTPAKPPVAHCPKDTLKLGVCADLLGLVNVVVGKPPSGSKCCALIQGLADTEAAVCLCTAIKANVLGINLDVPVALSVLLSACQKTVPSDFTCA